MPIKKIRSYLIAKAYDFAMQATERRCLSAWRQELFAFARGDLLEIGAGTGVNLHHYPEQAKRIVLCEPDGQMRKVLAGNSARYQRDVEIRKDRAEKIDLPDASFDTVVSTLVLCSVHCQQTALKEIYRLLRPDGRLIFLEHIISAHPKTRAWQQRIEPLWSFCAGDCRLTRDTPKAIQGAGFHIDHLTDAPMAGAPAFVKRTVRGIARKNNP